MRRWFFVKISPSFSTEGLKCFCLICTQPLQRCCVACSPVLLGLCLYASGVSGIALLTDVQDELEHIAG
jgi:hypothetical protein